MTAPIQPAMRTRFAGALNIGIFGRPRKYHPKREDFPALFGKVCRHVGHTEILCPRVKMSNGVVYVAEPQDDQVKVFGAGESQQPVPGFLRTIEPSDGAFNPIDGRPLAIMNADCPVAVIITSLDQTLGHRYKGVLHLGLGCMIRTDDQPSIIQQAADLLQGRGVEMEQVWIGGGAKPCCYGRDDLATNKRWANLNKWQPDDLGLVLKGLRAEKAKAIDLYGIAQRQLASVGVNSDAIIHFPTCTACNDRDTNTGNGPFWSSMRAEAEGATARNIVVVW